MRLVSQRYFFGPNIHSAAPGLVAVVAPLPSDQRLWRTDGFAPWLAALDRVLPDPQGRRPGADASLGGFVVQAFARAVRGHCAQPAIGMTLRGGTDGGIRVFLPCDDNAIALPALAFCLAASGLETPDIPDQLVGLMRTALAERGMGATDLALAREAVARGAPWFKLRGGEPGLRLGQGARAVTVTDGEADFDRLGDGRIPTAGVTGSIGKSTTCAMLAAILTASGRRTARSGTQGAWIGEDRVSTHESAGAKMALQLIADPSVEAAVLELARGGLIRLGTGIDAVDVGVVLNIYDNHLGLEGVTTRQALAQVKALVARTARHMAVLNADDPLCLAMRGQVRAPRTCLVTSAPENSAWAAHKDAGAPAARLSTQGELQLFDGGALVGAMAGSDVLASLGGRHRPALIAAMNAMAAAHGMGVGFATIRSALAAFEANIDTNPFRMSVIDGFLFEFVMTWADGPQAYAALGDFAAATQARRRILMVSMMGDRTDDLINQSIAAAAARFDHYVVSDWDILRGRAKGEVAAMLVEGLEKGGVPAERITLADDHAGAASAALAMAQEGDLLIMVTPRAGGERILAELGRPVGQERSGPA